MKLKMPGPNGIITLASDPDTALRAENKTAALALEALSEALAAEELIALRSAVDRDDVTLQKKDTFVTFWAERIFFLAFLRKTCLTYVCTQILLLPLTRL